MIDFFIITFIFVAIVWIATRLFLRAPDHSRYDEPVAASAGSRSEASPKIADVHRWLEEMNAELQGMRRAEQIAALRRILDEGLIGAPVTADELGVQAYAVDADGVPAEWVLAAGADSDKRLLYIHGGGFCVGSPTSARMLTAALSERCGMAVLSIDYRLMPENRRMDSIVRSLPRWFK